MIVKKFPIRNTFFFHAFICCLLLAPCIAGAAVEDHITRTESGFYYTVQKGDTLWDLSRKFSNTPWVWPELWSHNNPKILNPNLIYPGQKILIYKKDWEGSEKTVKLSQPIEPAAPTAPTEKNDTIYKTFNRIDQVGFIRKTAVPHYGTIFKSKDDLILIGTGAMVYIHPEPGAPALTVGGKYTIFRTFDRIIDPETKKDIGIQHLLTGVIEITSVESKFAIGNIVASYQDIQINDLLMPYTQRDTKIPIRQSPDGISGQVIKPEEGQILIGENAIIFINKGKNNGIEIGQKYSLFLQESARPNPEEVRQVDLTPLNIGEVFVLHTEPTTSTVLITSSNQQITAGNLVSNLVVKNP